MSKYPLKLNVKLWKIGEIREVFCASHKIQQSHKLWNHIHCATRNNQPQRMEGAWKESCKKIHQINVNSRRAGDPENLCSDYTTTGRKDDVANILLMFLTRQSNKPGNSCVSCRISNILWECVLHSRHQNSDTRTNKDHQFNLLIFFVFRSTTGVQRPETRVHRPETSVVQYPLLNLFPLHFIELNLCFAV